MRAFVCSLLLLPITASPQDKPRAAVELPADTAAALDRISADSLRGHLSFLASDLLEGRNSPSKGLDIAAEYIAAQYRRAGLEAVGDDGYFQTANWETFGPDASTFSLMFHVGGESMRVEPESIGLGAAGKLDLERVAIVKLASEEAIASIKPEQVEGKAVYLAVESTGRRTIPARLRSMKPAMVVFPERNSPRGAGLGASRLIDPETSRGGATRFPASGIPIVSVHDPKIIAALDSITGLADAHVSLKLGDPVKKPAKLKNVAGLLRGTDPTLKDTYILVTAHYDHIGLGTPLKGDAIYNGANDDGSGTVSVVEVASALATLKEKPKRSILFVTFFGEEHGLMGSKYYGRHPLVPVAQTVADVNLEQVGRTDDNEGPRVSGASLTGMDYSDVGKIFAAAGEAEGVKVTRHPRNSDAFFGASDKPCRPRSRPPCPPRNSDAFFGASDNQAMADLGVPAHTLCTAFMFPDYHGAGDHWDKIDYVNMAKIDRVVARAILTIAQDPEPPKWDASNPKTKRYVKAYEKLHTKPE